MFCLALIFASSVEKHNCQVIKFFFDRLFSFAKLIYLEILNILNSQKSQILMLIPVKPVTPVLIYLNHTIPFKGLNFPF